MTAEPLPPELALDAEPFAVDDLDAALATAEPTFPGSTFDTPRAWQITDDGAAEWAMRRLAEADAELRDLSQRATDWSNRIREWFEHRAKPLERRADFFRGHLHRYALARREAGAGATLSLPSGKVSTLPGRLRVELADADAFRAWAAANPTHPLVRCSYELAKADASKVLVQAEAGAVDSTTGELVPGVALVEGEASARVSVL